jgi:hypothetical protein
MNTQFERRLDFFNFIERFRGLTIGCFTILGPAANFNSRTGGKVSDRSYMCRVRCTCGKELTIRYKDIVNEKRLACVTCSMKQLGKTNASLVLDRLELRNEDFKPF